MRRLLISLLALLLMFARAQAAPDGAPTGRLDVLVDMPADTPYVGEPLRLVLRSPVRGLITNDRFVQPALTDFDWQQFGVDAASEELVDGFWTPVAERVLIVYPLRAGALTIPPFKRRVTYLASDNDRREIEFESQPLTIVVREHEDPGDSGDPWLPAKTLRITDRWEPDPDSIPFGETAKRIVTVEAEGVTANRLPPLPGFRAPGIITFAGPVERQTIVTDRGPIGRAVYRWSVRPVSATPAVAPAIRMRWFDVASRKMREAVTSERRVAFISAAPSSNQAGTIESWDAFSPRPLLSALFGFVSTAASVGLTLSSPRKRGRPWRDVLRSWRAQRALKAAACRGEGAAFRRALGELSQVDPDRFRRVAAREDIAHALAAFDAALFARGAPHFREPLAPLARKILAALKHSNSVA